MEKRSSFENIIKIATWEDKEQVCDSVFVTIELNKFGNNMKLSGQCALYWTKNRLLIICKDKQKDFDFFSIPFLIMQKPEVEESDFKYLWFKLEDTEESCLENVLSAALITIRFKKRTCENLIQFFQNTWSDSQDKKGKIIIKEARSSINQLRQRNADNSVIFHSHRLKIKDSQISHCIELLNKRMRDLVRTIDNQVTTLSEIIFIESDNKSTIKRKLCKFFTTGMIEGVNKITLPGRVVERLLPGMKEFEKPENMSSLLNDSRGRD